MNADHFHPTIHYVDLAKDGQTCSVVSTKSDHYYNLHKYSLVLIAKGCPSANACLVLKNVVDKPKRKAINDETCLVVSLVTIVLLPGYSNTTAAKEKSCAWLRRQQLDTMLRVQHKVLFA